MNVRNKVTIVTLSRYPDLLEGLSANLDTYAAGFNRVLVKDGYLIDEVVPRWLNIQGPDGKFTYSVNANLGLKAVDPDSDILLIGDDVRLKTYDTIDKMYEIAEANPNVGLLSPKILGGADNILQTNPPAGCLALSDRYLALVCTYIRRATIDAVGYLDESFNKGWGWDDVDFSRRVRKAGFQLAVVADLEVVHGVRRNGSESLIRNEKGDNREMKRQDDLNAQVYLKKWGDLVK